MAFDHGYGLPGMLARESELQQLLQLLKRIYQREVPAGMQTVDTAAADMKAAWGPHKWTLRMWMRLLSRYAAPQSYSSGGPLADLWGVPAGEEGVVSAPALSARAIHRLVMGKGVMPSVLQQTLVTLDGTFAGRVLPAKFHTEMLEFIADCVAAPQTWKVLRSQLVPLFYHVLLPALWLNAHDQELWREDPVEYILAKYETDEAAYSARLAAGGLLCEMARVRPKAIAAVLSYCESSLQAYARAAPAQRHHAMKEGVLYALGCLRAVVRQRTDLQDQVMRMLRRFGLPDLASDVAHLRACACWTVAQYERLIGSDGELLKHVLERVILLLRDPEIPVRYEAAVAFRLLAVHEGGEVAAGGEGEGVVAEVPQILESVLGLVEVCPNDEMVSALEALIDRYPAAVAPRAVQVCTRLCETFLAHVQASASSGPTGQEVSSSKYRVLSGTMSALIGLLQALRAVPHMYAQVEGPLVHVVHTILSRRHEYVMEDQIVDAVEIINYLTFCAPSISDQMWQVFQLLVDTFVSGGGYDAIDNINSVVDNFIRRDTARFAADPANSMRVYSMAAKYLAAPPNRISSGDANKEDGTSLIQRVPPAPGLEYLDGAQGESDYTARDMARASSLLSFMLLNCHRKHTSAPERGGVAGAGEGVKMAAGVNDIEGLVKLALQALGGGAGVNAGVGGGMGGWVDGYVGMIANDVVAYQWQTCTPTSKSTDNAAEQGKWMSPLLQLSMVRLSAHLLYYDAALTIQTLVQRGNLELFFGKLMDALAPNPAFDAQDLAWPGMDDALVFKTWDKHALVLGLSHLLLLPFNLLPPYLQGRLGSWVNVLVGLLEDITRVSADRQDRGKLDREGGGLFGDSQDGNSFGGGGGWGDEWHSTDSPGLTDSHDGWDDDLSHDQVTRWHRRRMHRHDLKGKDGGGGRGGESSDEGEDGEHSYTGMLSHDYTELTEPLEDLDVLGFFSGCWRHFAGTHTDLSRQLVDGLNPDSAAALQHFAALGQVAPALRLPALEEPRREGDSDDSSAMGGMADAAQEAVGHDHVM